jgi:molybdate transport system substrate-binding protein
MRHFAAVLLGLGFLSVVAAQAGEVQVAVASNFSQPMTGIAGLFQQQTGHEAKLSFGSSGKFTAQISHGAPFEVFLSADSSKPALLVENGLAQADSVFTYAQGRLALWSVKSGYVDAQGEVLKQADFRHLAMASPELAPYGEAAQQVIDNLQLAEHLAGRLVIGENISQAYQFVQSENAELGFVAVAQIMQQGELRSGSAWLVPEQLYQPIKQDAVLLNVGKDNPAALALLDFLRGDSVAQVLAAYGYKTATDKAAADTKD